MNYYLNTNYYVLGYASNEVQLGSWIKSDILDGYALLTGLRTGNMPYWSVDAYHIVAVYGYDYQDLSNKSVSFVDTASSYAGYSGPYFRGVTLREFWS